MKQQLQKILEFLSFAERLKFEMRHSWLSNGRQESVAEHVWRTSLMAMLISPYLEETLDIAKTLKMIIIHDIVEAEAGDVPVFLAETPEAKKKKEEKEKKAIENIRKMLDSSAGDEIYELWYEFEEKKSLESKFAQALDKLEAQIQHNEADLKTWIHPEKLRIFSKLDKYCVFHPLFVQLKEVIQEQTLNKLKAANLNIEELQKEAGVKNFSIKKTNT
jgi:putative hydrolase of HD superfamily